MAAAATLRSWLSLSISGRHAGPISTHISMRPPTAIRNYYILYVTWCGGFIWFEFITRFHHKPEIIKMSQVNFTIKVELTHYNARTDNIVIRVGRFRHLFFTPLTGRRTKRRQQTDRKCKYAMCETRTIGTTIWLIRLTSRGRRRCRRVMESRPRQTRFRRGCRKRDNNRLK